MKLNATAPAGTAGLHLLLSWSFAGAKSNFTAQLNYFSATGIL
jgi:hypothetical protein